MADALSECVEAALAAAVSKLDASKLSKVEVIVSQPRGVPAGNVTIVAHARAQPAMARKRDAVPPKPEGGSQRGSASQRLLHTAIAPSLSSVGATMPPNRCFAPKSME